MGGDLGTVVAVVLVLGVVAVFGYLHLQASRQRTRALQALAGEHGWQWIDEDNSYVREWGGEPFGRGRSRLARNILIGQHGDREIVTFDYEFKTTEGSGDNQRTRTHRFAVWLMTLPSPLPALEVRPEGVFGSICWRAGMARARRGGSWTTSWSRGNDIMRNPTTYYLDWSCSALSSASFRRTYGRISGRVSDLGCSEPLPSAQAPDCRETGGTT